MSAAISRSARFPELVWRHPLLAALDARAHAELESAGTLRSLRLGESLFLAGDPADALFVVVEGEIALRSNGRRNELRRLGPGDAVGEEAAARAHATRRHDASAAGDALVALLPSALLRRVMERGDASESGIRTRRWLVRALASDALDRADFARDLPPRARELMLDAGRAVELRRGEILYREGEPSEDAFFLAEGIVQLACGDGERRVLAYHKSGDFFGDEATSGEVRDATATATSDAWLFAVRAEVVAELARAHPDALARALRVQTAGRSKQREIRENATRHVLADLHRFETSRSLLAIDQERCLRCGHCAWSCAETHDDGVSRLLRRGDVVVAKVRSETRTLLLPSSCQHCKNPACMIDCPTGAIARDARGEVHIREELCTGCGSCAKACPWDNIQMAPRGPRSLPIVRTESPDVAVKCDLCRDRGGEPACVAACPADAIQRIDPSVDLDDVRAVLGRTASAPTVSTRTRTPWVPATIAAASLAAVGAFETFDAAARTSSGIVLLVLVALLFAYAGVKRFGLRVRGAARKLVATRPHFILHVALGTMTLGVAAAHAHGRSALAIAFWTASSLGLAAGLASAVIPRRLARIERKSLLPEELAGALHAVDARAYRDLSGTSDLLKGLYARVLGPHGRSWRVLAVTCIFGTSQRAMNDALVRRVHAVVGADDERLRGLEGLVATVVERQALRAQRLLTTVLRTTSFAHVVVAAALAALTVVHVIAQLRGR